jgi:hypothetical protein
MEVGRCLAPPSIAPARRTGPHVVSRSIGKCGLCTSLPAWMARLNIRLRAVSSRLISPADTGRLGASDADASSLARLPRFVRTGVLVNRLVTYARCSVVVIVIIRRLPKNGDRCFFIRRRASS